MKVDGNRILCAGKNEEDVCGVVVAGDDPPSLAADAWDAQSPADAEWTVPVAGAVNQLGLGLEALAARREVRWGR